MEAKLQNNCPSITVSDFVEGCFDELKPTVIAGRKGLENREITSPRIQKLGLALAGFVNYIHEGRIQIVGQTEISYLEQLTSAKRRQALKNLSLDKICCLLATKSLDLPVELIEIADEYAVPLVRTSEASSRAITKVTKFLQEILAPRSTIHGVLMAIYGIGVLVVGESGIGKSECALDLVSRGHRLISDDTVLVKRINDHLEGSSPDLTRGHLEIRGLGIIDIRDIFGVSAINRTQAVELLIELRKWSETEEIERLGLETELEEIHGVKLTKIVLPVSVGRNLSTLIETAVRVFLLRIAGTNAAKTLFEKHLALINPGTAENG